MKKIITILFLIPALIFGQVRMFLTTTVNNTPYVIPAISAGNWTSSASVVVGNMYPVRVAGTSNSLAISVDATTTTSTTLFYQFVSPPLAAQTISGNIKGQMRAQQSNATGQTARTTIVVTVINPAGTIVATLLGLTNGSTDLGTTLTNRDYPLSTALTSYTCNTNDRIVIEVGIARTSGVTVRTGTVAATNNSSTSLPEDNTTTTASSSWFEFSQNIKFNNGINPHFQ